MNNGSNTTITALARLACAVLACAAGAAAHAHAIWIERDAAGPPRAYFGEFGDDVREKSGDKLDRVASPKAWQGEARRALALTRRNDHIEIAATAPGDVLLTETGFAPREDKQRGGHTKSVYYARGGRSEARALLDFDLAPATPNGTQFVLLLRGAPVPRAEVALIGPHGWEKPLHTDEQGRLNLPATPWAGRYVLEASHIENNNSTAETAGQPYQRLRHVLTLSFVVEGGVSAPAR